MSLSLCRGCSLTGAAIAPHRPGPGSVATRAVTAITTIPIAITAITTVATAAAARPCLVVHGVGVARGAALHGATLQGSADGGAIPVAHEGLQKER